MALEGPQKSPLSSVCCDDVDYLFARTGQQKGVGIPCRSSLLYGGHFREEKKNDPPINASRHTAYNTTVEGVSFLQGRRMRLELHSGHVLYAAMLTPAAEHYNNKRCSPATKANKQKRAYVSRSALHHQIAKPVVCFVPAGSSHTLSTLNFWLQSDKPCFA